MEISSLASRLSAGPLTGTSVEDTNDETAESIHQVLRLIAFHELKETSILIELAMWKSSLVEDRARADSRTSVPDPAKSLIMDYCGFMGFLEPAIEEDRHLNKILKSAASALPSEVENDTLLCRLPLYFLPEGRHRVGHAGESEGLGIISGHLHHRQGRVVHVPLPAEHRPVDPGPSSFVTENTEVHTSSPVRTCSRAAPSCARFLPRPHPGGRVPEPVGPLASPVRAFRPAPAVWTSSPIDRRSTAAPPSLPGRSQGSKSAWLGQVHESKDATLSTPRRLSGATWSSRKVSHSTSRPQAMIERILAPRDAPCGLNCRRLPRRGGHRRAEKRGGVTQELLREEGQSPASAFLLPRQGGRAAAGPFRPPDTRAGTSHAKALVRRGRRSARPVAGAGGRGTAPSCLLAVFVGRPPSSPRGLRARERSSSHRRSAVSAVALSLSPDDPDDVPWQVASGQVLGNLGGETRSCQLRHHFLAEIFRR
ncbi:hypothetical protein THAOC_21756 [Thalassiosira oceanica]|uniref:Uncharacterized protein n=1 Tax=Thalassiosira oceanica TaxID=159749 RepID=K0SI15_THAOC|nr:hypothetical protein THAOC_21756 [Thalassiosira oceanica]|eukprot:EJK58142.1 hypothetical protein THAOC_21756 [Thalassiosira oceanica]